MGTGGKRRGQDKKTSVSAVLVSPSDPLSTPPPLPPALLSHGRYALRLKACRRVNCGARRGAPHDAGKRSSGLARGAHGKERRISSSSSGWHKSNRRGRSSSNARRRARPQGASGRRGVPHPHHVRVRGLACPRQRRAAVAVAAATAGLPRRPRSSSHVEGRVGAGSRPAARPRHEGAVGAPPPSPPPPQPQQ